MAAWDKWQKDEQGREIISGYEMKARRANVRWSVAELQRQRPRILKELANYPISREATLWGYVILRRDVAKARAAVANAVVAKAPNASPYQRARRGYEALPKTIT
jgi:hypothetical protein